MAIHALTIILSLILAVGAADQGTPSQERAALDGTWLVTSLFLNGVYRGDAAEVAIMITGNAYEQDVNGQVNERGTLRVDPSKKPMTIDFIITEGSAQNTTQLGIVEVSGDTLKLHLNQPGANGRPADFNPLDDHMLIIARKK